MTRQTKTTEVLAHPTLAAALAGIPQAVDLFGMIGEEVELPIGSIFDLLGLSSDPRGQAFFDLLETVTVKDPAYPPGVAPRTDLEDERTPTGSARVVLPVAAVTGVPCEVVFHGPPAPNGFLDIDVVAEVTHEDDGTSVRVGAFYDGGDRYVVRFLPPRPGRYSLSTQASARSLDQVKRSFEVAPGLGGRGPVHVDGTRFIRSDGTPFVPFGTTAYAWTHQDDALQGETLRSLSATPFNKLRMCVFPKHFVYSTNEPERFPFPRLGDDGFDWTRFDLDYFRHLEQRLRDLHALGIEADLILFHPYDRWGFADMGPAVDDRYTRYVIRRLSAFPNVWWSMANEYDFVVSTKSDADWDRLGRLVQAEDHVGHPRSIHNGARVYDHSADWITHASLQRTDSYRSAENMDRWLAEWRKPVVLDEAGYEGDLEFEWGNLTALELVRKFWEAVLRGGAMTHGETYWNKAEEIFWARGGRLVGDSVERIAFLKRIVEESPTGRLEPLGSLLGTIVAGVRNEYEVHFLGLQQARSATVKVRPGRRAIVDIIDAWQMTVTTLEGAREGSVQLPLPARPMEALRVRYVDGTQPDVSTVPNKVVGLDSV